MEPTRDEIFRHSTENSFVVIKARNGEILFGEKNGDNGKDQPGRQEQNQFAALSAWAWLDTFGHRRIILCIRVHSCPFVV
jgi:hypothetical protein